MVSIRTSNPEDINILADFQLRLAAETESIQLNKEVVSAGIRALFDDPGKGTYYVAGNGCKNYRLLPDSL